MGVFACVCMFVYVFIFRDMVVICLPPHPTPHSHHTEPPYHYYDACDTSANPTSDVQQAQLLRALAVGGLLHIGEPCWQQCTGGDVAGCAQCRSGSPVWVVDPTYPAAEDCNPAGASAGHNALPWRAGGVA